MFRYEELIVFLVLLTSLFSTDFMKDFLFRIKEEEIVYEGLLDRIVDDRYLVFLIEDENKEIVLENDFTRDIKEGRKYKIRLLDDDFKTFCLTPIYE